MQDAIQAERIRRKYESLSPLMDERVRRQWAAAEAMSIGWGGLNIGVCRDRFGAEHDRRRHWRVGISSGSSMGGGGYGDSGCRRRPQAADTDRSRAAGGVGGAG